MRIIAGNYKSRVLKPVPGDKTRPTTNRVREAWASTITSLRGEEGFEGARVLDAFAGSGALGIELLSRGAQECVFIDSNKAAQKTLRENTASLGLSKTQARILKADSLSPQLLDNIAFNTSFDIIILDPPYEVPAERVSELLSCLAHKGLIIKGTLISYEHSASDDNPLATEFLTQGDISLDLQLVRSKKYGTICLDYYRCQ